MTIRYDDEKEKEINELMITLDEKAMSKAFLATPGIIKNQIQKINDMSKIIEDQREEILELKNILASYTQFNVKLERFIKRGENFG